MALCPPSQVKASYFIFTLSYALFSLLPGRSVSSIKTRSDKVLSSDYMADFSDIVRPHSLRRRITKVQKKRHSLGPPPLT